MTYLVVLRGNVRLEVSDEAASLLIDQVSGAMLRGSAMSVGNGCLLRVDDVQLIAPTGQFVAAKEPPMKAKASIVRQPAAAPAGKP